MPMWIKKKVNEDPSKPDTPPPPDASGKRDRSKNKLNMVDSYKEKCVHFDCSDPDCWAPF